MPCYKAIQANGAAVVAVSARIKKGGAKMKRATVREKSKISIHAGIDNKYLCLRLRSKLILQ